MPMTVKANSSCTSAGSVPVKAVLAVERVRLRRVDPGEAAVLDLEVRETPARRLRPDPFRWRQTAAGPVVDPFQLGDQAGAGEVRSRVAQRLQEGEAGGPGEL